MDVRVGLLLLSALTTGKLFILRFQGTELIQDTSILAIYLVGILTALAAWFVIERSKDVSRRLFFVTFIGSIIIFVLVWTHQIFLRQSQPFPTSRNDGETQSEEAARFILAGRNPYGADYRSTSFSHFYQPPANSGYAMAATHYAYPPLTALLFVPTVWFHDRFGISIDHESLYALLFFAFVGILLMMVKGWDHRTWIIMLLLSNPFAWTFPVAGYNDIVFIFFLAATAWSMKNKRWALSGVMYGFALASKQTAWLSLPFVAIFLWSQYIKLSLRPQVKKFAWTTVLTAAALFAPFVLWSPSAAYNDLVRYVGGAIPGSFPLADISVLQYLYTFGFVRSPWSNVPSWPFQLGILLPLVFWLGRRLISNVNLGRVFSMTCVVMIVAALFTRFGSDHYYVAALYVGVAGWALSKQGQEHV